MTTIGRLKIIPLRELWRHEALDFTRWLVDEASWPSLQERMIDGMVRLEKAFVGHLR